MKNIFTFLCGIVITFAGTAQTSVSSISKSKIIKSQEVTNKTTSDSQISMVRVTDSAKPSEESLSLKETEFDFGKIPQGKPVTHVFEFTNNGATPFSLDNVQASCGCTTPVWN